jgi:alanyl aminopeptidase
MRRQRLSRLAVDLVGVVFVSAFVLSAAQRPAPEFRLPDIGRPTRYQLDLTIVPSEPTFQGSEAISINLKERTGVVWLNAKDLTIQEVNVQAGGASQPARWWITGEFLAVDLPEPMGPGPVQIAIRYGGKLDEKSNVGAYRRKSGNDWYVYTSFTPIDARRAFPCFDEPGYKAPWEVTLHVKRDQVAVANAPVVSETDEPGGMKRVVFAPTQPLPSEVVALAVGPFDVVDAGAAGEKRIPVRIITPRGRAAEAAAARSPTPEIVAQLEQYTGIPYPWDKLDHLAVLDMPFGATENPGLITYRDRGLLAPPERDTPEWQRSMRGTMAHELAHQWFGNLVTQAWWDDVWLSEGFATWLGMKVSDMEFPPFERGLAITAVRDRMMAADSPKTRPVRLEMHSRKDTDDVYDDIVYQKGAAVLEMLEDWLGPEPFRRSLHRYLTHHQFGNATTTDLARAIQQESGVNASPVLFSFLDRPGAPLFRFSLASDEGASKLEIEQGDHPWTAPVCFHADSGERRCQVVNASQAEVRLPGRPAWMWPNAYGSGYYRSLLTPALLEALVRSGYNQLTKPERLALAGDVEALMSSGDLRAADVMKILPQVARDREPRVTARATAIALQLAVAAPEAVRAQYAAWLKKTMGLTVIAPEQAQSMEEFFREKQ